MSKFSLILAMLLTALIMCLSACGESADTSTEPVQGGAEQASPQVQEALPTAGSDTSGTESGLSPAGSDQQDADAIDKSGDAASVQNNGASSQQEGRAQKTDNDSSVSDGDQGAQSNAAAPTSAVFQGPTEIDNAEVDFNDL